MGYEGRKAEYLQWMEKTLQVDPLAISARANVIGAADDRGDDRKRDQELLRARQLAATDADALYVLDRFYLRHFGDAVRAAEAARSSIALSPPSPTPDATTILHRALVKVGAFDEAERLLQSTDWASRNPAMRAYEQAFAAGSRDDLAGLGAAIESVRALPADQVRTNALIFWQAVEGNCADAHALLDYLAKVPHLQRVTVFAGLENEQVDDATMWCLSAGGRHKEAQKAIDETRADLRAEVADHPRNVPALVELAAIESIEKNDDAAVASLDKAFKRSPTPYVFNPQVPWFTRLRGKPDYDRLVASWKAARDKARTQVLAANAMRTSDATSSASGR